MRDPVGFSRAARSTVRTRQRVTASYPRERRCDTSHLVAIVRMLHVALGVEHLERALAFYRDALGFSVLEQDRFDAARIGRVLGVVDAGPVDAVLLRRGGFLLQLLHRPSPSGNAATGASPLHAHLALAVDDLASTLHSLRDRGVVIEEHTRIEHAPGVRSCVVRDPDGMPVLLCEMPPGVSSAWDEDPLDA